MTIIKYKKFAFNSFSKPFSKKQKSASEIMPYPLGHWARDYGKNDLF
jgi:hypothetical protein